MNKKTAFIISTWFYSGKSPKAPGTMGSLATLPLAALMACIGGQMWIIIAAAICFVIGMPAIKTTLQTTKSKDPGFVVIDEVVGQLLAFSLFATTNIFYLLIGFGLFRFFDIVKVWPACYFDKKVRGPFGIMMDDVVAGLYAGVVLFVLHYWI